MALPASLSLIEHFSALEDPRQSWKVLYPLPEVLFVALCGTLAGAEDFVEVRRWAGINQAFLRRFLPYAAGLPSHDTLDDVVNAVDGGLFARCFTAWVEGLREGAPASGVPAADGPEVVAVDGKTSRRTHNRAKGRGPLHGSSHIRPRRPLLCRNIVARARRTAATSARRPGVRAGACL